MPISETFKADIEEGQRLRGWITNAYAQIEYLLGDLILRCREFPQYAEATCVFSHSAKKRAHSVKLMLDMPGPLSHFSVELTSVIKRFEEGHNTRNLLAHGFCEYIHTQSGDAGLKFQKFHRDKGQDNAHLIRIFQLVDLKVERDRFVELSDEALRLFMRVHKYFGWTARPGS